MEVIRYRGASHYAAPGSVVVLEPGEPHTGAPADSPSFVYRVMYPGADMLGEGAAPRFRAYRDVCDACSHARRAERGVRLKSAESEVR
jgi:AraC-like ligand binding domain